MKGSVPYSCTFEATPTAKNDVDEIVVTLKMLLNVWKGGGEKTNFFFWGGEILSVYETLTTTTTIYP